MRQPKPNWKKHHLNDPYRTTHEAKPNDVPVIDISADSKLCYAQQKVDVCLNTHKCWKQLKRHVVSTLVNGSQKSTDVLN